MDLLLWRHAEAVDGYPDHDRALTQRGHRQAQAIADWLARHHPHPLAVLVSPTVRTRQTASAYTNAFSAVATLGPRGSVADLLTAAQWPDAGTACLIVGHQPTLGRTAAQLLCGSEQDWVIKKGALWWFTNRVREGRIETVVRAVIPHDLA